MKKKKFEKIIFLVLISLFIILILGSWIYGVVKKPDQSVFSFETCVEKYIFVYEDLCDSNLSFYVTYPEMEIIEGKLNSVSLEDYPYTVFSERCIQYYKTSCMKNGKV